MEDGVSLCVDRSNNDWAVFKPGRSEEDEERSGEQLQEGEQISCACGTNYCNGEDTEKDDEDKEAACSGGAMRGVLAAIALSIMTSLWPYA